MFFIRRFEETLLDLFSLGKLVGTTHTYIGQEANAVGLIDHLDPDVDTIFEPPLPRALPRVHGRRVRAPVRGDGEGAGVCGGKGGSQHLCKGNFYSNGVLGSIVPVATGIALAEKRGSGAVSTVFLGDGTLGEGRDVRVAQHRALAAPCALRRREQPLRAVDARRARARRVDRGARRRVRRRGRRARHDRRRGDHDAAQPSRVFARPARRSSSCSTPIASARTRSRTISATRPRSRSAHARPLLVAGARLDDDERKAIEARCEERLAETVEAADAAPAATPGVAA